jgi:hypothetical protein
MTSSTSFAPRFEQTPRNKRLSTGVYFVRLHTVRRGTRMDLHISKDEYTNNASARGGAYRTSWVGRVRGDQGAC